MSVTPCAARLWCMVLAASACGLVPASSPEDLSTPDAGGVFDRCSCHPEQDFCGCRNDLDCHCYWDAGPRCDPTTHQCVACLPERDNCPAGQACGQWLNQWRTKEWKCLAACAPDGDCRQAGARATCCQNTCVDPQTNPLHCGGCGKACAALANGTSTCLAGQCVVDICNAGFRDCDGAPDNGCEVAVNNDPKNCGQCGNVCVPFAGGDPACTTGVCGAVCSKGLADCNNDVMDGCEIDVTSDRMNCGQCGGICAASKTCKNGKCG